MFCYLFHTGFQCCSVPRRLSSNTIEFCEHSCALLHGGLVFIWFHLPQVSHSLSCDECSDFHSSSLLTIVHPVRSEPIILPSIHPKIFTFSTFFWFSTSILSPFIFARWTSMNDWFMHRFPKIGFI